MHCGATYAQRVQIRHKHINTCRHVNTNMIFLLCYNQTYTQTNPRTKGPRAHTHTHTHTHAHVREMDPQGCWRTHSLILPGKYNFENEIPPVILSCSYTHI